MQSQAGTPSNKKFLTLKVDEKYWWYFPFVVFFALLFYKLGDIAGLHRDEAVMGLSAIEILHGARPISGAFNEYTSPLYYYIVASVFSLFGKSIWMLRISGIVFNLIAGLALFDVVRRYSPRTAIHSLWVLATLPVVIVLSRIAFEQTALNPFFLFGGIWCFAVLGASQSTSISRTGYALAGLCFGLGVWNHLIFAPTVLAVAIVYVLWCKPGAQQLKKILPPYFIGVFIAAIPKLYMILWLGRPLIPASPYTGPASPGSALLNLIYTYGGDSLYARSSGEILFSLNWFLPLCLAASTAAIFVPGVSDKFKKIYIFALFAFLLGCVITWIISPGDILGSRFWLLPLWFVSIVIGAAVAAIEKTGIRVLVTSVIVTVNLVAIGTNYFYAFAKTDGIPKQNIYVGGRYDNSTDFVDLKPVLNNLLRFNNKPFYIEDVTPWRAWFLTPESQQERIRLVSDVETQSEQVVPGSLFAFYRIPNFQFPSVTFLRNLKLVEMPRLSTSNYVVYVYVKT
ncbi:MAG: ArnT family glycosyltransferase [Acidiferrobacterales bacterium]